MKSYNGNGLLPVPINYTNSFGKAAPLSCVWYTQAQKNGFVANSAQPTVREDHPRHDLPEPVATAGHHGGH